jgi:hypothetical protein
MADFARVAANPQRGGKGVSRPTWRNFSQGASGNGTAFRVSFQLLQALFTGWTKAASLFRSAAADSEERRKRIGLRCVEQAERKLGM